MWLLSSTTKPVQNLSFAGREFPLSEYKDSTPQKQPRFNQDSTGKQPKNNVKVSTRLVQGYNVKVTSRVKRFAGVVVLRSNNSLYRWRAKAHTAQKTSVTTGRLRGGYKELQRGYSEEKTTPKQRQFLRLSMRVRDETGRRPAFNAGLCDL